MIKAFVEEPGEGEDVTAAFDARELPQDAAVEAVAFNLRTHEGLIVMQAGDGGEGFFKDLGSNDSRQALQKYGEFLSVGLQPAAHAKFSLARCTAKNFLTAADYDPYFPTNAMASDWKGPTEFEKRRVAAQFETQVLPKLESRAVKLPQRFLLVGAMIMPEYDFDRGGFHFRDLTTLASVKAIQKRCPPGKLILLPTVDQLRDFWKVDAAKAEAVLNAIEVNRKLGARNLRRVFLATKVELVDLTRIQPVQLGPNVYQPPLRLKILSSTLYGDETLTQKVFSPTLIVAKPSVLEAGLPGVIVRSASYNIEYGGPDQLALLKKKGDFEEWEWTQVARQQMQRDTWYYTTMRSNYHRDVTNPPPHDTSYTPFFPYGYDQSVSARGYDGLKDEQKALFKQWSKMQANAL